MPKFDIPGRTEPASVVLYRDNKERVYPLPFDATNPVDIEILTAEGLSVEKPKPVATLTVVNEAADLTPKEAEEPEEAEPAPKPRPSRKEV